jgi:hypothetical protein
MTRKGRKSKKLVLCLDTGTSLIKVMYRTGTGLVKHLCMDAMLLKLPASSASSLPQSSGLGKPEDNAWIQLHPNGDCYVVGRLAQEYRASVSIKKLKYESIVPKVLAVVAAIAAIEPMYSEIELQLGLLLPYGEYSNAGEIEAELAEAAKEFFFQGQPFKIELSKYRCYPEGYGLAMSHANRLTIEQFQRQTFAYLMFGYRNTSLLLFRHGTLSRAQSRTTQLGFYDSIDKVTSKVSGLSREEVQASIRTVEEDFYNTAKVNRDKHLVTKIVVEDLIKSTDSNKAAKEKGDIEAAIKTGTQEYWQLIINWLDEVLPPLSQLNEVVYCGGTSEFLKDKLIDYFASKDKLLRVSSSSIEEKELIEALQLDERKLKSFKEQNLALRFADNWSLFVNFAGYEAKEQQAVA